MSEAKETWASEEQGKIWEKKAGSYNNRPSESYLTEYLKRNSFKNVLEIGAGNGRLIGLIKKTFPNMECHSVDINEYLCGVVRKNHPGVITHHTASDDLSEFATGSVELVYTFQNLQHCPPEEIKGAISEIKRVAGKQILLMEGHVAGKDHGERTHPMDGGSFNYNYGKFFPEYKWEVREMHEGKIKIYIIKK